MGVSSGKIQSPQDLWYRHNRLGGHRAIIFWLNQILWFDFENLALWLLGVRIEKSYMDTHSERVLFVHGIGTDYHTAATIDGFTLFGAQMIEYKDRP
jgi:hypothetical protein